MTTPRVVVAAAFVLSLLTLLSFSATAERQDEKIWICHAPLASDGEFTHMSVDETELIEHQTHKADILEGITFESGCPAFDPDPDPTIIPDPTASPPDPTVVPTEVAEPTEVPVTEEPTAVPTDLPGEPETGPIVVTPTPNVEEVVVAQLPDTGTGTGFSLRAESDDSFEDVIEQIINEIVRIILEILEQFGNEGDATPPAMATPVT